MSKGHSPVSGRVSDALLLQVSVEKEVFCFLVSFLY